MKANRDKTGMMGHTGSARTTKSVGGAEQQPSLKHGNSVSGGMKPVKVKKAASMNLDKGEPYNRGKI